jgi:Animal haem peroxidase
VATGVRASVGNDHLTGVRDHCLAPSRAVDSPVYGGKYGRMFPSLPALEAPAEPLLDLGQSGGPCDGSEVTDADDAVTVAAGWPIFGQFIAHDITSDRSPLQEHANPGQLRNFRTPQVNLECVYGAGPAGSPYLYDLEDPAKLLAGTNDAGAAADLPRNSQGVALIGDPRNDVHTPMSQLHLAMIRVHNGIVDRLRQDGVGESDMFEEARRATTWHYQWIVLNEFLPLLAGEELTKNLLEDGGRWYGAHAEPFIPFEFADAAYRYGHSQIRHSYRLHGDSHEYPIFPDLVGFRPVPSARAIDWSLFFDYAERDPAPRAKKIDGRLAASLISLPVEITGQVDVRYRSLAARDLVRGGATGLPSGEAVARELGAEPIAADAVGLEGAGWKGETPLWFYILKEAETLEDGERLGPVGARIVADVLVTLIERDGASFRSVDPGWRPTLPAAGETFGLADLLAFSESSA